MTQNDNDFDTLGCFRGMWCAVRCEVFVIAAFVAVAMLYYGIGIVAS